jgi:hypothetical protein
VGGLPRGPLQTLTDKVSELDTYVNHRLTQIEVNIRWHTYLIGGIFLAVVGFGLANLMVGD